jgi:hypothetical protein
MKKLFAILFALLLTLSLSAQRQGDTKFGLVAGMNAAYPVGDDMEDFIDDWEDEYIDDYDDMEQFDTEGGVNPRIGMHLGASFDYFLADNVALSSGIIYSQKGYVMRQKTERDDYLVDYSQDIRLATQLDYIDIPIGIKYVTDEGFEISGGLIVSILASDKVNGSYEYEEDGTQNDDYYDDYFDDIDDYEDMWDEDPEERLTGFQAAVGYTFNEKFTISFKIQKTSNFGDNDYGDDNQNLTLQLSTGFSF